MNIKIVILGLIFFLGIEFAAAQKTSGLTADILPFPNVNKTIFYRYKLNLFPEHKPIKVCVPAIGNDRLPIFCRLEANVEKKTGFPVRFRLGSVDYVNYLEGKQ